MCLSSIGDREHDDHDVYDDGLQVDEGQTSMMRDKNRILPVYLFVCALIGSS